MSPDRPALADAALRAQAARIGLTAQGMAEGTHGNLVAENPVAVDAAAGTPEPSDLDWDDWERPPRTPAASMPTIPMLHLAGFDGPMDLLLDLAERQRIDWGRMSILALAEQFVAALEQLADHVAIERRADWLVMATRLLLLRSRLLFPENPMRRKSQSAKPRPSCGGSTTWPS